MNGIITSGQTIAADLLQDFLQTSKKPKTIMPLDLQYFADANMHPRDAIHGAQGVAWVTIDGNRHKFAQLINIEARADKTKTQIPIMGQVAKGNKATGIEYTGSATFYFNTSIFRKMLKHYQDTGEDTYFDIQVTNEDGSSQVGRQTTILIDCNVDGGIVAALDADAEYLEDSFDFTFERFEMPTSFNMLPEML